MVVALPPITVETKPKKPHGPGKKTTPTPTPTPPQPQPQPQQKIPAPLITPRFGSKEVITLQVNGELFTNWKSVRVEQKVTEWFPTFQFESTEETPVPLTVNGAQFIPGDIVRVYVGGIPAIYGYINERHVGYDTKNHGVRLIGAGKTMDLTNSCVPLDKLNGHDGKSWVQLATDLSAHLDVPVRSIGAVDDTTFESVAIQPGETIQAVLERYARMRNIVIGCDPYGALLAIGENQSFSSGMLIEGSNILRANCALRDPTVFGKIFAIGQDHGSDGASGDGQNKQVAELDGSSTRNRHMIAVAEIADSMHGIERRAQMEKLFTEGSMLEAQITVQGFFKDNNQSDSIWRAGEYYGVNAPMLILNNMILGCSSVAFEQTDAGSTTTLTMVDPLHMNGLLNFRDAVAQYLAQEPARAAAPGPNQTQPM